MIEFNVRDALAPLLLRLALAAIFIYTGLPKTLGLSVEDFTHHLIVGDLKIDNGGPTEWGAKWMPAQEGKDPLPAPVQMAVAWGELVGGLALVLGLLTRVAAAGLIIIMAGAIATVTGPNGFSPPKGYAFNMLIIVVALVLVLHGAGNLSFDRLFRRRPA